MVQEVADEDRPEAGVTEGEGSGFGGGEAHPRQLRRREAELRGVEIHPHARGAPDEADEVVTLAAADLEARPDRRLEERREEIVLGLGEARPAGGPAESLRVRVLEVAALDLGASCGGVEQGRRASGRSSGSRP